MVQKYNDNANGDVPLTVVNVIFLISFGIKLRTCYFGEKKTKLINCFLYKNIFIEFPVLKLVSMVTIKVK